MDPLDIEDILIRSLQGRIDEAEAEVLERWRARAPENEAHYQQMSTTWRLTAQYGDPARERPPATEAVLRAAAERRRSAAGGGGRRRARSVAAVIASLGLGYLLAQWSAAPGGIAVAPYSEVTTGEGERATVTMLDGTAVRLGPRSTLRVTADGNDPVAWLDGRAFFGVHPDPTRTFTVQTPYGEAVALGTRFEVRTDEEAALRVLVVQGEVRVSSAGVAVDLAEGMMSRSVDGAPPSTSRAQNPAELLDWMGTVLVFRQTPLDRAISEIAHRYRVSAELRDAALGDVAITGTFADQPIADVIFVVCEIVGAACVAENDGFLIGAGSPVGPTTSVP